MTNPDGSGNTRHMPTDGLRKKCDIIFRADDTCVGDKIHGNDKKRRF